MRALINRRKSAFTLIEIIVTVAILLFLAGFTIPTFQYLLSQFQLSSAADEVANYLRMTEQKTVTEQKVYGVTLTTNGAPSLPNPATNQVIPQYVYNSGNLDFTQPPASSVLNLPSNIQIQTVNFAGNSNIYFSTSGAPNVSGSLVIRDTVRNRSRLIEIKPSGAILSNTSEY